MREKNISLKCCYSLKLLIHFWKGFRFFHPGIVGFVGQRASKLLAVKDGALKNKSATLAIIADMSASMSGQGSSLPGFESFSNLTDRNFVAL